MSSSFSLRSLCPVTVCATVLPSSAQLLSWGSRMRRETYALSVHSPAAVDHDGLSCDKGGGVAGEEGHNVAYVLGFAAALEALLVEYAPVQSLLVRMDPLGSGWE